MFSSLSIKMQRVNQNILLSFHCLWWVIITTLSYLSCEVANNVLVLFLFSCDWKRSKEIFSLSLNIMMNEITSGFWRSVSKTLLFQPLFLEPSPKAHMKSLASDCVRQRHQGIILVLTVRNISPFRRKIRMQTMTFLSFMPRGLAWVMPIKHMIFFIYLLIEWEYSRNSN